MRFLILLLLPCVVACSENKRRNTACPREQAAFRVEITAGDEPLPADTVLLVNYQGTLSEGYAVAAPPKDNEDVCCQTGPKTAGALPPVSCGQTVATDAAPGDAILCELWTGGVTEIVVTADGFAPLQDTLEAQMREDEECGLTTVDVHVVLMRAEGGMP